jgi:polyhydroxyalkanoate synthase
MLTDFLRGIYMENSLITPGRLKLAGRHIDLREIRTPCYFFSTIDDHIAPWKATYPATQILSGPVQFVLGGSGHIAGVINPPSKKSTDTGQLTSTPIARMNGSSMLSGMRDRGGQLRNVACALRR